MSKKNKIWLIAATLLLMNGAIIFCIAMSMIKWDFDKLSTVKYELNTYEITDEFNSISINVDRTDLIIVPSLDNSCKVVCKEDSKIPHSVAVENEILTISVNDEREWKDYINIYNGDNSQITIYVPYTNLETIDINICTGDVKIEKLSVTELNFTITTGDLDLNNIFCDSITSRGTTGDIKLDNVIVKNEVSIKRTTGDVEIENVSCEKLDIIIGTGSTKLTTVLVSSDFNLDGTTGDVIFDSFDAKNIYISLTTGDVEGNILTDKIFNVKSSTGKVNVPDTYNGGICKISTTTGDIIISYK